MSGALSRAKATELIRSKCGPALSLCWTRHAKQRLAERGLILGDVLHVLKFGFVHQSPVPTSRPGIFKYAMECVTPNSNGRTVRVVLIPFVQTCEVKIVTVMWVDESGHQS